MKYLCVIPSYYPALQFGGSVTAIHALNTALARAGVDVTVYTTDAGLKGRVVTGREMAVNGVKVTYFDYQRGFDFLGQTGWHFSLPLTGSLFGKVKEADIVYLPAIWNYPTLAAAVCCRVHKKPYVIAPHGSLYPFTFGKKSWKKRPYYQMISKRVIRGAAAVHYTTEDEKEKTSANFGLNGSSIVVPNGQDHSEFKTLPDPEPLYRRYPELKGKKVVLFLGRINWKKGLDLLAEGFSLAAGKIPGMHLLIAGPDEDGYERKIRSILERMGALGATTFTGNLTGDDRLRAFAVSRVFVLPSYSENFGMSVIEAMAAGVPVIVSDNVGIHCEIAENHAGLVIGCNAGEVAENMIKLLENDRLSDELAANAATMVEEYYDLGKVAQKMAGELQKIILRANK
ncbi:MAG TPA: glycosyltransferase [Candidatus Omnitrophota bacterium]|nr:glycosyltransferase [Candidatus Omnitrophota bacterium]